MSDDKPFAEIKPETSIPDAEGFSVVFEGEELCPPWGNWSESGANDYAAKINAAVTARERKAAAQALRDLAASVRAETGVRAPKPSDPFWRDHFAAMAERKAESVEKGER